jgi:C4-dicarboxylate-specific signal transduction histidine kinase
MLRKDGSVIWVNITGAPVPAAESNLEFHPAIVVNVTEQKRAEEALRLSRAELARVSRLTAMGELTASIAHEVNQPLAAIVASGNACRRWLASDQPNLDRARDSVDRIIKDAHHASEIITRVRSMTRKAPPAQLPVDINDVIGDVLSFARGELPAKRISVRPALRDGLPGITGDRVQLQQVVLNLVMNAIEAMASITDRQRVLTITSQRADAAARSSLSRIRVSASMQQMRTISSMPSSPLSRAAWEWVCRSAHRLLRPMGAASGHRRTCRTALHSILPCRPRGR